MNLFLLEDDEILSEIITEHLVEMGFCVDCAYEGFAAYDKIQSNRYDIMLLDINVPNLNGFELFKLLKDEKREIPTIFITSLNSAEDVKRGFDLGVDDYLKKPFDLLELEARVKHLIKVYNLEQNIIKVSDNINLDCLNYEVLVNGKNIKLTKKEFDLLKYFVLHRDRIISTQELISNVWQSENIPTDATIRTYIKNLRNIVSKDSIISIKGVGYRFDIK